MRTLPRRDSPEQPNRESHSADSHQAHFQLKFGLRLLLLLVALAAVFVARWKAESEIRRHTRMHEIEAELEHPNDWPEHYVPPARVRELMAELEELKR